MRNPPWSGPRLVWTNPNPPDLFDEDDAFEWPDSDGWPDNVSPAVAQTALSRRSRERHRPAFYMGAIIGLFFALTVVGPFLGLGG